MVESHNRRQILIASGATVGALSGCLGSSQEDPSQESNCVPPGQYECPGDGVLLAKLDFEDCEFIQDEGDCTIDITDFEDKPDEECEPISFDWEVPDQDCVVNHIRVNGGNDCEDFEIDGETEGSITTDLETEGGQQAAISNVIFCGDPDPDPDPDDPEVKTKPATKINESTATLNGELTDMGGFDSVDVYFEWREVNEDDWETTDVETLSEEGSFWAEISGLEVGVEYEFRAVAVADGVRVDGDIKTFTKDEPGKPHVKTKPATDINKSTAVLNGRLTEMGGFDSVDVYFEWREVNEDDWETTDVETLSEEGSFWAEISGLETGTTYEFRAVAKANDNQVFGEILEFTKDEKDHEKKQPDVKKDVHLKAVCYDYHDKHDDKDNNNDDKGKKAKFAVYNDTKHDLKFSWKAKNTEQGGKLTVPSKDKKYIWVKPAHESTYLKLYFDDEMIHSAYANMDDHCKDD